jgi:hypothetical protein
MLHPLRDDSSHGWEETIIWDNLDILRRDMASHGVRGILQKKPDATGYSRVAGLSEDNSTTNRIGR